MIIIVIWRECNKVKAAAFCLPVVDTTSWLQEKIKETGNNAAGAAHCSKHYANIIP